MRWLRPVVIITLALGILGAWLLSAASTDRGSPAGHLLSALMASYLGAWAIVLAAGGDLDVL